MTKKLTNSPDPYAQEAKPDPYENTNEADSGKITAHYDEKRTPMLKQTKNSPESESLAKTVDSSTIPDLRKSLRSELRELKTTINYSPDKLIDDLVDYVIRREDALLNKVVALFPDDYEVLNKIITRDDNYKYGYNTALAELRAEIAKLRKGEA